MAGHCGTCTACCRVYAIPQLNKPAGKWCEHCAIGVGCKVYDNRPELCVDFACVWLQSHQRARGNELGMPIEMRPDKCKVVFSPTTKDGLMAGITMPGSPDAWRKGEARRIIDMMLKAGLRVVVGPPASTTKIMLTLNSEREVQLTEPDENGMQWSINE
jgi:hypothetical protein